MYTGSATAVSATSVRPLNGAFHARNRVLGRAGRNQRGALRRCRTAVRAASSRGARRRWNRDSDRYTAHPLEQRSRTWCGALQPARGATLWACCAQSVDAAINSSARRTRVVEGHPHASISPLECGRNASVPPVPLGADAPGGGPPPRQHFAAGVRPKCQRSPCCMSRGAGYGFRRRGCRGAHAGALRARLRRGPVPACRGPVGRPATPDLHCSSR